MLSYYSYTTTTCIDRQHRRSRKADLILVREIPECAVGDCSAPPGQQLVDFSIRNNNI